MEETSPECNISEQEMCEKLHNFKFTDKVNQVYQLSASEHFQITISFGFQVFLFLSPTILTKGLLGKVITALEDKGLRSTAIEFKIPDAINLKSSILSKSGNKAASSLPSVFSLWTGKEALVRVKEVISHIGNQYDVAKVDMVFTENAQQTKKELDLWFAPSIEAAIATSIDTAIEANGAPPGAPPGAEERQSDTEVTVVEVVNVTAHEPPIIEEVEPETLPHTTGSPRRTVEHDSGHPVADVGEVNDHATHIVEEHVLHVNKDVEEVNTLPTEVVAKEVAAAS